MKREDEWVKPYREFLLKLSSELQKELKNAPKGRLRISMKKERAEYYCCDEGKGTAGTGGKYINKSKEKIIFELAQKEYNTLLFREVTSQLRNLERYPSEIGKERLTDIYDNLSDVRKMLVIPKLKSRNDEIHAWLSTPYEPKGFGENAPEIYTEAGERVRSKSEKMIADKLKLMGIPYKYECPMKLNGYGIVYPDFTILSKNTMKQAVLEHFGMMDNPEYSVGAVAKIRRYEKSEFYLGKNLFLTFETSQMPFDAGSLEAMLEDFV